MKVIKDISCAIERYLENAEEDIKMAVRYKMDDPDSSKIYYANSVNMLGMIKPYHDRVVTIIKNYRAEKGEPPAPMMAIYDYEHEKHINKMAAIKQLQELYNSGM